jgi:hypothetical protein
MPHCFSRGRSVHAALRGVLRVTSCEFGFAPAPPSVGRGAAGRPAPAGEGRGASRSVRMLVRVLDTYVVAEVLIVHMRALGSLRSERIAGGGCRQRQWRVEISIYFRGCGGRTLRVPCCIARKMRRMLHVASYMARGGILSTTQ